ncbi:molybdopterin-guanine dinucleotide biosynthesis protein A [Anoxybacillus tepidamans]|uniref:Probable molybdenum cofactor guanylyltransferase n=1 Tax=Anoxybacteroides tepidamans TaxID=265948 RepID=A0A7W8ISG4_9BACL|nr:molybdenum cofactor guanylyltransferase [Anoxybacillus tepidamans]MBB5325111.1 molybdopterin-guanine dinucleotide biosynthesis protein A [Anoxybacillus tepidamans]
MKRIVGAILAGGQSRRFGSPKAFAKQNGVYFFQRAVEALRPFVQELYIVSHPALVSRFQQETSEKVIVDEQVYRGQGPLAGIYTVMKQTEAEWIFVLPCDMPYMRASTIGNMVSYIDASFDIVVSAHFGRVQPLVGAYHHRVIGDIERLLKAGNNRMFWLLEKSRVRYVKEEDFFEDERVFRNINRAAEYDDIVTEDML